MNIEMIQSMRMQRDWTLVRLEAPETVSPGGIVMPDMSIDPSQMASEWSQVDRQRRANKKVWGQVIDVGPGVPENEEPDPEDKEAGQFCTHIDFEVGDYVYFELARARPNVKSGVGWKVWNEETERFDVYARVKARFCAAKRCA